MPDSVDAVVHPPFGATAHLLLVRKLHLKLSPHILLLVLQVNILSFWRKALFVGPLRNTLAAQ